MRVYVNSLDKGPVWSIDTGDVSSETQWDEVVIEAPAVTECNLSMRGSKTEPCCWLRVFGTLIGERSDGVLRAVIR